MHLGPAAAMKTLVSSKKEKRCKLSTFSNFPGAFEASFGALDSTPYIFNQAKPSTPFLFLLNICYNLEI